MIDISAMKSRRSSLFLSSAKAGKAKVLCHATCQSLNHSTGAAVASRDRTTTQRLVAPHGLKFSSFPRSREMRERYFASCMREHMQSVCYTAFCTARSDSRSHSLASSMTHELTATRNDDYHATHHVMKIFQ